MTSTAFTRRRALQAIGALAGAPVVPAAFAQGREKLQYLTPFGYLINFVETMYADTGGFFAKNGLDVTIVGGRGSAMAVQQVSAGNVLVSRTGGTDLIKAAVKDPSIVSIAEIYQRDLFHFVSPEAKAIRTPKDFAGKTVGLVSNGGASENLLDMMLAREGIPADSVKRQVTGDNPGAYELVNAGRIDGFFVTQNNVQILRADKKAIHAWSTDQFAPAPSQVYISSRKAVAERPEALARFLRGVHETLTALQSEKDYGKIVDSMVAKYEVAGAKRPDRGLPLIEASIASYRPAWRDKLGSDPGTWRSAYELMVKAKIVEPVANPAFHTDEIRKRAFG
jgi:ABC-type nitrate/sulfonate/bicarbonate transport system substrate-binding protein